MENYEFYYKDVWDRTLESIKQEEAYKIKEEDLYYFNGSRLYDCNDTLATISTQLEIGAICLNSYKEIIAAHLSKILNKDFYWHALRHFFATMLSENNIPTQVIQSIVGWDSADMVNLYVDTSADESIGKYFGAEGIKQVEQKSLNDI